jgi:hypothetical protein
MARDAWRQIQDLKYQEGLIRFKRSHSKIVVDAEINQCQLKSAAQVRFRRGVRTVRKLQASVIIESTGGVGQDKC